MREYFIGELNKILTDPFFAAAQIVGLFGLLFSVLSFQQKERKGVMKYQVLASISFALQLFLLRAFTGAYLDTISIVRTCVFANKEKKWASSPFWLYLFTGLVIIVGILTFNNSWINVFAIAGTLLSTVALWMKNSKHIRMISLLVGPCWIIYNLAVGGYTGVINEIIAMTSIVIGIIRHDLKKEM